MRCAAVLRPVFLCVLQMPFFACNARCPFVCGVPLLFAILRYAVDCTKQCAARLLVQFPMQCNLKNSQCDNKSNSRAGEDFMGRFSIEYFSARKFGKWVMLYGDTRRRYTIKYASEIRASTTTKLKTHFRAYFLN